MTKLQIAALKRLENSDIKSADIPPGEEEIYGFLSQQGFADFTRGRDENGQAYNFYRISQLGCAALSEAENMARQQAANKRQNATQNKLAVIGILVAVAVFALGLIVEHCSGFVEFLVSLLH